MGKPSRQNAPPQRPSGQTDLAQARLNRWLIGILSIGCLVAGVALIPYETSQQWQAAFIRVGIVLAALWLCLPTRGRTAAWASVSPFWVVLAAIGLMFVARRPYVMIPIFGLLFVLAIVVPIFTGRR